MLAQSCATGIVRVVLYVDCMNARARLAALIDEPLVKSGKSNSRIADEVGTDQSTTDRWRSGKQAIRLVYVADFCVAVEAEYEGLRDLAVLVERERRSSKPLGLIRFDRSEVEFLKSAVAVLHEWIWNHESLHRGSRS